MAEFAKYYPGPAAKTAWAKVRDTLAGDAIGWQEYKALWSLLIRHFDCVVSLRLLRKTHLRKAAAQVANVPSSTISLPLLLNWIHDDIEKGRISSAPPVLVHWRSLLADLAAFKKGREALSEEMRMFLLDSAHEGLRTAKQLLRDTRARLQMTMDALAALTPDCRLLRVTRLAVFETLLSLMESVREHKKSVRQLFQRRLDLLNNGGASVTQWDWFAECWKQTDHSKLFLPVGEGEPASAIAVSTAERSSKLSTHWLDLLAQPHLNGEQYMDSISHLRESLTEVALTDNECSTGAETVGVVLGQLSRLQSLFLADSGLEEDQVKGVLHSSSASLHTLALFDHRRWDQVHPVKMMFPSKKLACGFITTLVVRNHGAQLNVETLLEGLRLVFLDLSGNEIEKRALVHVASQRHTLAELVLEGCDIDVLPDDFAGMTQMVTLLLAGNRLSSVPHCVYSMPDLVCLDLRDNIILRVDHMLPTMKSMRDLQA